jgi:hypothetical protein
LSNKISSKRDRDLSFRGWASSYRYIYNYPEISVGFIGVSVTQSVVVYVPITACPSPETEISVSFTGDFVAQSLVVYVAITVCPSSEPEISVGFIGFSVAQSLVVYVDYRLSNRNSNKTDRDLRFSGRANSYSYIYN